MERLLQKMAVQLNSCDETSLMALWEKYASLASRFEPTKRWEEAALIFCLIQAMHWKNQLFNYNLSQTVLRRRKGPFLSATPPKDNAPDHLGLLPPDLFAQLTELGEALERGGAKKNGPENPVAGNQSRINPKAPRRPKVAQGPSGIRGKGKQGCKVLPFRPGNPGKS